MERLLITLLNGATFVRNVCLWDGLRSWVWLKFEETRHVGDFNYWFIEKSVAGAAGGRIMRNPNSRAPPPHAGHTVVGWHPILQPAFLANQPMWLCWLFWHTSRSHICSTGLKSVHCTLPTPNFWSSLEETTTVQNFFRGLSLFKKIKKHQQEHLLLVNIRL